MATKRSTRGAKTPFKELPPGPLREAMRERHPEPKPPSLLEEVANPLAVSAYKAIHKKWRDGEKVNFYKQSQEKILLLMDHYGIDREAERKWELLSMSLALEYVPGFQIKHMEAKRGPKTKWNLMRHAKLYCAVMMKNSERKQKHYTTENNKEACRLLARMDYWKEWGDSDALYDNFLIAKKFEFVKEIDRAHSESSKSGEDFYSTFFEMLTGIDGKIREL